jgi:hypothetical protein
MLARLLRHVLDAGRAALSGLRRRVLAAMKPVTAVPLVGALADLRRSKPELVAENALLRQQLVVLRRSVRRPRYRPADRAFLVLLAGRIRDWRQALLIVQPTPSCAGTVGCFTGTGGGSRGPRQRRVARRCRTRRSR